MINFEKIRNSPVELKKSILFGDNKNPYIPFYAGFGVASEVFKIGDERVLIYGFPDLTSPMSCRTLVRIITPLISASQIYVYNTHNYNYYLTRGFLSIDDKVKMLLSVKSDYFFKLEKDNLDYSQFVLFINRSFVNNNDFKSVYKKIEKEYIKPLIELGVDVVYTNDVHSYFYKSVTPKFKSFEEIDAYSEILNQLI